MARAQCSSLSEEGSYVFIFLLSLYLFPLSHPLFSLYTFKILLCLHEQKFKKSPHDCLPLNPGVDCKTSNFIISSIALLLIILNISALWTCLSYCSLFSYIFCVWLEVPFGFSLLLHWPWQWISWWNLVKIHWNSKYESLNHWRACKHQRGLPVIYDQIKRRRNGLQKSLDNVQCFRYLLLFQNFCNWKSNWRNKWTNK